MHDAAGKREEEEEEEAVEEEEGADTSRKGAGFGFFERTSYR